MTPTQNAARRRIDSIFGNRNHSYWRGDPSATREMEGYFRALYPAPRGETPAAAYAQSLGLSPSMPSRLRPAAFAGERLPTSTTVPYRPPVVGRGAPIHTHDDDGGGEAHLTASQEQPGRLRIDEGGVSENRTAPPQTVRAFDPRLNPLWQFVGENERQVVIGNLKYSKFGENAARLRPLIEEVARQVGLPPSLIGGIIATETAFDEDNKWFNPLFPGMKQNGKTSARGMMQVTRRALEDVIKAFPHLNVGYDDLGDTRLGIVAGAHYLKHRIAILGDENEAIRRYGTQTQAYVAKVRVYQDWLREHAWP